MRGRDAVTPLVEEIDYVEPVAAFAAFEDDPCGVLLESAVRDRASARYSYIAAEPFLDNDERIATWKTFYKEGVDALNLEDMRSRTSGPQISKPMGPTP